MTRGEPATQTRSSTFRTALSIQPSMGGFNFASPLLERARRRRGTLTDLPDLFFCLTRRRRFDGTGGEAISRAKSQFIKDPCLFVPFFPGVDSFFRFCFSFSFCFFFFFFFLVVQIDHNFTEDDWKQFQLILKVNGDDWNWKWFKFWEMKTIGELLNCFSYERTLLKISLWSEYIVKGFVGNLKFFQILEKQ